MTKFPSRIVCLTEETTETLYLLGQGERIVGVSGYTVRPPEARQKPKVSAFINARFDKIEALKPDLVLAFSDLQADLAAELVRRGIAVVTFNQRTIAEILQMIRMLGGLVGCPSKAEALADTLSDGRDGIRSARSATTASSRSNRRTSSSQGRPALRTVFVGCTTSWQKQFVLQRRNDAGDCALVEQQPNGALPFRAEVDRVLVHV